MAKSTGFGLRQIWAGDLALLFTNETLEKILSLTELQVPHLQIRIKSISDDI